MNIEDKTFIHNRALKGEIQIKFTSLVDAVLHCIGASMHASFNVDWQMSWTKYLLRASATFAQMN